MNFVRSSSLFISVDYLLLLVILGEAGYCLFSFKGVTFIKFLKVMYHKIHCLGRGWFFRLSHSHFLHEERESWRARSSGSF